MRKNADSESPIVFHGSLFAFSADSSKLGKMLHDFRIRDQRVRLWQRDGESYRHVLMKALGYAMFAPDHPGLEIETDLGLKYKPDLIAQGADGVHSFWGECGQVSIKKTHWLLKHTRTERLVLFKIAANAEQFAKQLREEIPAKYRPKGRLSLINFRSDIVGLTEDRQIAKVLADWYTETAV